MTTGTAVAMWLAAVIGPGLALLRVFVTGIPLGRAVLLAPPAGLGFVYAVGIVADRAGLPLLRTCELAIAVVTALWLVVELVRLRAVGARPALVAHAASWRRPSVAAGRALLAVAVGLGLVLWRGMHAKLAVPAGWDAMHDGFYVRQIVDHGTLDPSVVLSSDPLHADGSSTFYPLAPHLVAAILHGVSGLRISLLLLALTVAFGGVILPIGVYALTRRLAPAQPAIAGLAAVASVLPGNLFTLDYYGKITTIAGLALIPAVVALFLAVNRRTLLRVGPACAFALIGLVEGHTSEVPVCVGLVIAVLVVDACHARQWRPLVGRLARLAGLGVVTAVLLVLVDPSTLHMLSQRTGYFAVYEHDSLAVSVKYFVLGPPSGGISGPFTTGGRVWLAVALAGCLAPIHPRWRSLRGAALGYAGFVAFGIAWSAGYLGPLRFLGDPWYQARGRMVCELVVLGAIPVALAVRATAAVLAAAVGVVGRAARPAWVRVGVTATCTAAVLAAVVWATVPPVHAMSRWARANQSPVGASSVAAFRYLEHHIRPGQRVLDDLELHGDTWMYVDYRVPTLFGNPPLIGHAPASWKERLYLRGNLKHIRTNGCVTALLRAFDVQYVFFADQAFTDNWKRFGYGTVSSKRFFRRVFYRHGVGVYRVLPQPTAPPCEIDTATDSLFQWSTIHNST